MNLDSYLTPHIKINSKWIKGLNTRVITIKLLEENKGVYLHGLELGNSFLDISYLLVSPKAQATKGKKNR